jgi:hypothetical protein
MTTNFITIVSGLPRSGTSMMMKMLEAGGMRPLIDNIRSADEDNPQGYYELERVKQIEHDKAWLPEARGKVVKMISELLRHLPREHDYRVVFMRRKLEETLASQKQMLVRRGQPTELVSQEKLAELFQRHLERTFAWLAQQPNFATLYVQYAEVLQEPATQCERLNAFLGNTLDVQKMMGVVDQALYRQRK